MEILVNLGLGILGIIAYTLFKSIVYVYEKEFVFSIMLYENIKAWIWSVLVIATIVVAVYLEPEVAVAIKTIFAIDIDGSPAGFFIFGAGINLLVKPASTEKQRIKRTEM